MMDWQIRVLEERSALVEKMQKLVVYMGTTKFLELPLEDADLLAAQLRAMNEYQNALRARISRWNV